MVTHRSARVPGRLRAITTITVHPDIRAQLLALATQHGVTFSHAVELVLTRRLDLPALSSP